MADQNQSGIIAADFNKYNSPIAQSSIWPAPPLYEWQEAVLAACWKHGAQVAVRTCNESGKSSCIIPLLAASFASAFHGSQIVITSASERQLKKQMEPSLKNYFLHLEGWNVMANEIESPSIEGYPSSKIIWFSTKSGDLFEGFHVKHFQKDNSLHELPLLIIIDEAKSVKHDIFLAIERCNPTVELRISTCGEDSGDFYDACMNKSGLWTTSVKWNNRMVDFKVPWTMCPHLQRGHTYERKKALLKAKGTNDPDVASILLAEFFRGGTYMVFEDYDLQALRDAMSGVRKHTRGAKRAFCDFSGGGDEMTFGYMDGNRVHPIVAWRPEPNTSPHAIAERYIRLFKQTGLQPSEIDADNGGLGMMIINELHANGWPINRIQPNTSPIYKDGFVDAYAEMHWKFKELLHNGDLILPQDDILIEQCRLRRYMKANTDENRIRVEPKQMAKRSRREVSPDRLDTIVHLCRNMEAKSPVPKYTETHRCPTIVEYWKAMEEEKNQSEFNQEAGLMSEW